MDYDYDLNKRNNTEGTRRASHGEIPQNTRDVRLLHLPTPPGRAAVSAYTTSSPDHGINDSHFGISRLFFERRHNICPENIGEKRECLIILEHIGLNEGLLEKLATDAEVRIDNKPS